MMRKFKNGLFLLVVVMVVSANPFAGSCVQARIQRFIIGVEASADRLFIAELGGRILIFDVEKNAVVEKRSTGRPELKLTDDNGRILAHSIIDGELLEISSEGFVKCLGDGVDRFKGIDREHIYASTVVHPLIGPFKHYRFNKNLQNRRKGHFPEHPDLVVNAQTEDPNNYWFFCYTLEHGSEEDPISIAIVRKSKDSGKLELHRLAMDSSVIVSNTQIANDQKSVWLLLYYSSGNPDTILICLNKRSKVFSIAPYLNVKSLVPNLDWSQPPRWAYAYAYDRLGTVFPLSQDLASQIDGDSSSIDQHGVVDGQKLKNFFESAWKDPAGEASDIASGFAEKYYHYRPYCTYRGKVWLIGLSHKDDGSLYHIISVDLVSGKWESFEIQPTIGERIENFFEGIKALL